MNELKCTFKFASIEVILVNFATAFCFLCFSLFVPFFTCENSSEKKLKSCEGKSFDGSALEFFFSRLPPFSSEGDEILFRGGMIYIKEMLFGNKQSSNEGRRQLGGALG